MVTYLLDDQFLGANLRLIRSVIYSLDTIAIIVIYFVPKLTNLFGAPDRSKDSTGPLWGTNRISGLTLGPTICSSRRSDFCPTCGQEKRQQLDSTSHTASRDGAGKQKSTEAEEEETEEYESDPAPSSAPDDVP